jgi:hypothetical protein
MVQRPTATALRQDNSKAPDGLRPASLEPMKQQDLRSNYGCPQRLSFYSLESPTGAAVFFGGPTTMKRIPTPMKAVQSEATVTVKNPICGLRGDDRDSASTIHPIPAIVRWVWRLITFRSLTHAGFRPEEDSRSRGIPELCRRGLARSAGQQNAAGPCWIRTSERSPSAKCKV